jgi:predicted RNA-binding Zn-ribbon protein involved in translation (DUF1610 family)
MEIKFVDPTGDGTEYPTPYPTDLNRTVYNGDKGCTSCGLILNPVQALNSDICPSCSRRQAVKRVKNKMV